MAITQSCLSAISQAKAWGNPKKPKLSMAYLLIVPGQAVEEERTFGLVTIWVHPCKTLLSLLEEAAKKVTLLTNTTGDWPYSFVQLCEDSQHIPLSNARHISLMVNGVPSRSACRCLSCLEVHKLLQCGSEVVYPEGLNGDFELIWVPLPKQSVWDAESTNEPAMLQVNLPRPTCRDVAMAASQWSSMPISSPHSVTECPSDTVTRPSMEEEVERLLSSTEPRCEVELDHSGDGDPTSYPGEPPRWRWREDNPLSEHLRGTCQEAFHKDSDLVQHIRQTYFRAHSLAFHKEVTHVLANVSGEMAKMAGLMGTKFHPVQDQWQGKKELHMANNAAKGTTKSLCYFWKVSSVESSKIMGLKGIHSPEALKHQAGLSFCP